MTNTNTSRSRQRQGRGTTAVEVCLRQYLRVLGLHPSANLTPEVLEQSSRLRSTGTCTKNAQQLSLHRLYETVAVMYCTQRKFLQAETFAARAATIREELFGARHLDTLRSKSNLAVIFAYQSKNEEAYTCLKDVYELLKQVKGEENYWTLRAQYNLAMAYARCGKFAQAKELLEKVPAVLIRQRDVSLLEDVSSRCLEWLEKQPMSDQTIVSRGRPQLQ